MLDKTFHRLLFSKADKIKNRIHRASERVANEAVNIELLEEDEHLQD